jgi:hypothetical protein
VFERDSEPLPGSPEDAWLAWERRGVAQFRQAHYLHPPAIQLLDSHLPDVKQALIRAGCITFDVLATMPPTIADSTPREGDQRFTAITGRRPAIEYAVASVAEKLLPIRRGVAVVSLLSGPSVAKGIPHVTGVRTMDGEGVSGGNGRPNHGGRQHSRGGDTSRAVPRRTASNAGIAKEESPNVLQVARGPWWSVQPNRRADYLSQVDTQ